MKKPQKIAHRQAQGNAEQSRSITKEMTIRETIQKYPKTTFIFIDYGLHCVGCPLAQGETIEEAVKLHRIDLEKFLEDLNKVANKK